jgi:hypothetical protein
MMEAAVVGGNQAKGDSNSAPGVGLVDRGPLQVISLWLCFFAVYLMLLRLFGGLLNMGRLETALLQFIPYCFLLAGSAYYSRTLVRFDRQTLLMVACLGCVFIVLCLEVTRNLKWLVDVPVVGRNSRVRGPISSLAIMVALAAFPAASYFMIKEVLLAKRELNEQVEKLQEALRHVQRLQGLLPICMYCHKIRTDEQSWQRIEHYISEHSEATFTHGLCPECAEKHYPDLNLQPPPASLKNIP